MEFFDAGLFGEMGKLYHYKSIWQKGDDISEDSYTANYFSRQLLRVMNINEEQAFNRAARFKYRYMRKLYDSSVHISSKMEKIRDSYISKLPKRKRIMVLFFMFTKWLKGLVLLALKREILSLFLLFINFFCCFFFLFYTQRPEFGSWLVYSLLYWNLCSMIITDPITIRLLSILLVYPFYIVDFFRLFYNYRYDFLVKGGKLVQSISFEEFLSDELEPFGRAKYCSIFVMITVYNVLLIAKLKTGDDFDDRPLIFFSFEKIKKGDGADKRIKMIFISTIAYIVNQINHWFRYIPLTLALCVVLFSINILNILMLAIVLFLLWKPNQDRKFWIFFLVYCFFCTIVKHIGKEVFGVQHFNVEAVAMIGLTTIEENIFDYYRSPEMIALYSLSLIVALRYKAVIGGVSPKGFSRSSTNNSFRES